MLSTRDLRHLWHPCTQMKDHEEQPLLEVVSAQGCSIRLADGRELVDGLSSWWCKSLGHGHPEVLAAVSRQMEDFEHVIFAGTTNRSIVELGEELALLDPNLQRCFFADSGSDAVEIAVKMSLQFHAQNGSPKRRQLASLRHGYHGETLLTMALGDCDLYSGPFRGVLPPVLKLENPPHDLGDEAFARPDPETWWQPILTQLNAQADELACVVLEPLIQGAGGMLCLDPELLRRLRLWTEQNGVHLITDEIMNGCGRLGEMLSSHIAGVSPDFAVLSKGLSSGFSPFSTVLTRDAIYEGFYDDYATGRGFLHSNTYCGNAIGVAASLATLRLLRQGDVLVQVREQSPRLRQVLKNVAAATGRLGPVRGRGFVAAADLHQCSGQTWPKGERRAWRICRAAASYGALLRPLGDTLYLMPPLIAGEADFQQLEFALTAAIREVCG